MLRRVTSLAIAACATIAATFAITELPAARGAAQNSGNDDSITFWKDVRPILQKNCTICHSQKNLAKKELGGGLALSTFDAALKDPKEPVIVAGNANQSKLFQLLITKDEETRMPKDTDPLADSDIELIRKWIDGGASEGERPATVIEPATPLKTKRPTSLARSLDVILQTTLTLTPELAGTLKLPAAQASGKLDLSLKIGPLPAVTALAYSPAGESLVVGSYGSISIWDLAKAELVKSIETVGAVHGIAMHAQPGATGYLAAAGGLPAQSSEVLVYDTSDWKLVGTISEHTDVVYDVAFSPDGQKLATASLDKTVRVWSIPDCKPVQTLKGHSDFVYSVNFTPDGKRLISSSKDRSIKIYSTDTWESERTLSGHNEEVLATAVSGDSYNVVSAGKEPQLRWWIIENGQNNRLMPGHNGSVNQIVFSKDGKRIASVGQDKQVRIWDGSDGKLLRTIAGSTEWLYCVALSTDAKIVAAGSWDGVVRLWDAESGRGLATLITPTAPDPSKPQWIAMTPEGFYHASQELGAMVQWRTSGQVVASDTLASTLNKAELVQRALRGEAVESPRFDAGK
jgi:WD40 repeat protein